MQNNTFTKKKESNNENNPSSTALLSRSIALTSPKQRMHESIKLYDA